MAVSVRLLVKPQIQQLARAYRYECDHPEAVENPGPAEFSWIILGIYLFEGICKKPHPDRGGSDYLAAMINQAKDLLLGK